MVKVEGKTGSQDALFDVREGTLLPALPFSKQRTSEDLMISYLDELMRYVEYSVWCEADH